VTTYRLEVSGGPDEEHLTHIASLDHVATQGHEVIKTPYGVAVVQASLARTTSGPPPASTDEANVATGHLLFVSGPENLLTNPGFKATKDATGATTVAGWRGVSSSGVTQETGGPLPSGGYQSVAITSSMSGAGEIVCDRIPVQPGAAYVFSGWVRTSLSLGIRYLDADGKMLSTNQFGLGGNNDDRWWWCAYKIGAREGRSIPGKAAFIELFLRPNQDFAVAGLSFEVWPPTPESDSTHPKGDPAPPKPSAGN
jgi:hypothetical protein